LHRGWLDSVLLSSISFRERQANGASHSQQACLSIRGKVRCLRRPNSCPPSPSRSEGGGWQFNSARGVCCCSPTSLSPAPVSALSIPHFRTPTQMPCTPKPPSVLVLSCTRSHLRYLPLPFPGSYRCETAAPRSRRRLAAFHRVPLQSPPRVARLARSARRSGRVGRYRPHTRPCESRPHARSLTARSAAKRRLLTLWLRLRLP
jgi:hypothetical protein